MPTFVVSKNDIEQGSGYFLATIKGQIIPYDHTNPLIELSRTISKLIELDYKGHSGKPIEKDIRYLDSNRWGLEVDAEFKIPIELKSYEIESKRFLEKLGEFMKIMFANEMVI
jgi:hypothetical protein